MDKEESGVTLVIGTALLKCAAAIGMVEVLQNAGIPINRIVASGTGAVYGAALSLGYSREETLAIVTDINDYYHAGIISASKRMKMAMNSLGSHFGLLDGDSYQAIFKKHFAKKTFQDALCPLTIVAANFNNAERILLEDGYVGDAVMISGIVPGVIPPHLHRHQLLVGGMVIDPVPVATASENNSDVILSMGFETPFMDNTDSIYDFIYQLNSIHTAQMIRSGAGLANLVYQNEIISINPPFGLTVGLDDLEQLSYIIERGGEETAKHIDYIQRLLARQG